MTEKKQTQTHLPTPPMLINEIARLFHGRMRNFAPNGVKLQDSARAIMRHLVRNNGCSQLDLVQATHLKAPTVSVGLKHMEEFGLVRRETDAMDMRVTRVFLTEAGLLHNELVYERLRDVDAELMRGFSEEETRQLLQYLERVRDNILPVQSKNDSQ